MTGIIYVTSGMPKILFISTSLPMCLPEISVVFFFCFSSVVFNTFWMFYRCMHCIKKLIITRIKNPRNWVLLVNSIIQILFIKASELFARSNVLISKYSVLPQQESQHWNSGVVNFNKKSNRSWWWDIVGSLGWAWWA